MGFPRQEYWRDLPFPSSGDICNPGIESVSPALAGRFFTNWATRLTVFVSAYFYLTEKAMAPHASTLAWKIPWTEEPGRLQSMGSLRVGHDGATSLSLFTFMHWRRKWQPTPVFLPGESQGQGAWWAAVYWVVQSWTQLKRLSSSRHSTRLIESLIPLFLCPWDFPGKSTGVGCLELGKSWVPMAEEYNS